MRSILAMTMRKKGCPAQRHPLRKSPQKVSRQELPETGRLDLSGEDRDRFGFVSGSSTHADRLAEIRATWESDGVLIDPHTADGVHVARRLLAAGEISGPVVVLETALPVKFAETITQAIGIVPPRPERFAGIEDLPRHVTRIPVDADAVRRVIGGVA